MRSGRPRPMNARRFLLSTSTTVAASIRMYQFLLDNGMTRDEYQFFLRQICGTTASWETTIISRTSIGSLPGRTWAAGEISDTHEITKQYFDRYRLPVMHTETNLTGAAR